MVGNIVNIPPVNGWHWMVGNIQDLHWHVSTSRRGGQTKWTFSDLYVTLPCEPQLGMQNHVTTEPTMSILESEIGMGRPHKGGWMAYAGHTCGGLTIPRWSYLWWSWPIQGSNGECRRGPIISTFPIMQPLSACYFIAALEIGSVRILQSGDDRVIKAGILGFQFGLGHWISDLEPVNMNFQSGLLTRWVPA